MASLTIGISGKRNIAPEEHATVALALEKEIRKILEQHGTSSFVGFTALAEGADTIFAETVTGIFKMPLKIVLPFGLEQYAKDFDNEKKVQKLNDLVHAHPPAYVINKKNTELSMDEKKEAYFNAGKYIVDHCSEVIFVWDGLKPAGKAGTAEVIGYYAQTKNRETPPIVFVRPAKEDSLHTEIEREYCQTNGEAIRARDHYRRIWKLSIFLGWMAVLFFSAGLSLDEYFEEMRPLFRVISAAAEAILVVTVFFLIIRGKRKNYHGIYLENRYLAETYRLMMCFYHTNTSIALSDSTLSENTKRSSIVENINAEVERASYHSKWYSNYVIKKLINEQIRYHQSKIRHIGMKPSFFEGLNLAIAILFMLNLIMHLVGVCLESFNGTHLPFYPHHLVVFVSILLPATYAAIEGILHFQEWHNLRTYSSSAEKSLSEIMRKLPVDLELIDEQQCEALQSAALNLAANTLATDNRNWKLILENKNNYQWVV